MDTSKDSSPLHGQTIQILLVSLALMMFEINLVRLFSVIMHYHLAFFVLAIALFGIGLGGLYAQILRRRATPSSPTSSLDYLPILLSISIIASIFLLTTIPISAGAGKYPIPRIRWLFAAFLSGATPFFFGSMFMSQLFARRPQDASRLYFSDLAGAGLGCLLAVPALQWLGGLTTPFLVACVAVLPAFGGAAHGRRPRMAISVAVFLCASLLGLANQHWDIVAACAKSSPLGKKLLFAKWNTYSVIGVEDFPEWTGWRLSTKYRGDIPPHLKITQDGRAPAYIVKFDGDYHKVDYLRYDITAVPYYLGEHQSALIVGAGGGRDILTAKLFGIPKVTGVEINPITINDVMLNVFRDYSGNVYGLDGVRIINDSGRTFARRDQNTYDVIVLSLADTQSASAAGASVLSENHLYTAEAFQSYWDQLAPGGICCVVSSAQYENRLLPRMANTMRTALAAKGVVDPAQHILAVISQVGSAVPTRAMCLSFTKSPATEPMVARARQACEKLDYELAWPPADTPNQWTPLIAPLLDPSSNAACVARTEYDVSPLDDDRPYLFYNAKPGDFLPLLLHPGASVTDTSAQMGGIHLIIDFFMVAFFCVLGLMISPLLLFRRDEIRQRRNGQLAFLAIFFLLGIGYILIEVSTLEHCFLLLGDPTRAFAITLFAMLTFTGIGSLLSQRFQTGNLQVRIGTAACAVVLIQLCVLFLLPRIVESFLGSALPAKILVVLTLMAIMATPMGMLFPSAIRLLGHRKLDMTCWSWGMNGVGSVLGSVGATILSLNLGIHSAFMAGILCYALAAMVSLFLRPALASRND